MARSFTRITVHAPKRRGKVRANVPRAGGLLFSCLRAPESIAGDASKHRRQWIRHGAQANKDLEQLWRRIVFYVCTSNTDDHLRNHGFLLKDDGWVLSPAYDINPVATGGGLALNISKTDNSQSLDLVRSVAPVFRVDTGRVDEIISDIIKAVRDWEGLAKTLKLPSREINQMKSAFRVADEA